LLPPAKAGSESKTKNLDAGLKASSTRALTSNEFFSSLLSLFGMKRNDAGAQMMLRSCKDTSVRLLRQNC
jgi:hypothetical protein